MSDPSPDRRNLPAAVLTFLTTPGSPGPGTWVRAQVVSFANTDHQGLDTLRDNIEITARLLDQLEARMGPEALADLLEDILGEEPVVQGPVAAAPLRVACT